VTYLFSVTVFLLQISEWKRVAVCDFQAEQQKISCTWMRLCHRMIKVLNYS